MALIRYLLQHGVLKQCWAEKCAREIIHLLKYSMNELPLAWKRKCNGKLYGLDGVHVMYGKVMVWLRESGTNRGLHLPLTTLARNYQAVAVEGYQVARAMDMWRRRRSSTR